jgi:uncharacterized BrkB/YihY/UPF0761 family membrane protein
MGLGPASTPGRDIIIAILTLGLVVVLLFVIFPDRLTDTVRWIVIGALAAYHVLRFLTGIPKWSRRR